MNDYRLVLLLWLTLSSLAQAGAPGSVVDTESEAERSQLTPVHPETTSSDANKPLPPSNDINQVLESLGITGTPREIDEPPSSKEDTISVATSEPLPPERIVWDKTPIRLTLPVGRERLVHFPTPVKVGVPAQLEVSLRTQSVDGTVYWLAQEAFTAQRIQVRDIASGQLYLLDLAAQHGAPATPVIILRPDADNTSDTVTEAGENTPEPRHPPSLGFVSLTRHAAQQMYAPTRLHQALPGVYRVPLKAAVVRLVRGSQVQALPLITWRGGDFYVTVVRLRNLTTRPLILDPRDLRGTWHAATFQHARLLPAGDEADTTCVYLISARPFADALNGAW